MITMQKRLIWGIHVLIVNWPFKHIAKHHSDDESETKVIQLEEEAVEKKVHKEDEQLEELEAELSALKKLM